MPKVKYVYDTIEEIQVKSDHGLNVDKKTFNLFGVVKNFRHPAKSKGPDYFCILRIIDDSFYENDGIKVTLFHEDIEMMPCVNEFDVVRLHRMKPSINNGEMVLMSSWGWSVVQWDDKDNEVEEGKTHSKNHTISPKDKDRVKQLKDWVKALTCDDSIASSLCETEQKLENVERESYFTMTCQVTGILKLGNNLTVLRVWDGSMYTINIPFIPDIEKDGMIQMDELNAVKHLMVDVCVYDNHSKYIADNNIALGSYILFRNLNCARRKNANDEFELILHGGACFDREVNLLDDDDPKLEEIKKRTNEALLLANEIGNGSDDLSIQSISSPRRIIHSPKSATATPTKKKVKLNESISSQSDSSFKTPPQNNSQSAQSYSVDNSPLPQNFTVEKVSFMSNQTSDMLDMLELMDSEKTFQDDFLHSKKTSLIDEDSEIDVVGTQNEEEDLRCQLSSSTVVFGDSPFKITSLSEVVSAHLPTGKSKLFRVRIKIDKFSSLDDSVIYYCPATNLRINARNSGNDIKLPKDVGEYLHLWRRFRGLNDEGSDCDVINDEDEIDQQESQLVLPNNEVKITMFNNSDGSIWHKYKVDNETVIHKLKKGSDRFNILYTKNINSKEDFEKFSRKYDRVVHVLSRERLTANSMPPVCYQDGVFYYCSPGCIGQVRIPTLSQEAKTFHPKQPLQALTCPLLLLRFCFQLSISDQSGVLSDIVLQAKHAVEFFNDTTAAKYLLNDENCKHRIEDDVRSLTDSQNNNLLELIIEKKARKSTDPTKADVIFYDVTNTRLKKSLNC